MAMHKNQTSNIDPIRSEYRVGSPKPSNHTHPPHYLSFILPLSIERLGQAPLRNGPIAARRTGSKIHRYRAAKVADAELGRADTQDGAIRLAVARYCAFGEDDGTAAAVHGAWSAYEAEAARVVSRTGTGRGLRGRG